MGRSYNGFTTTERDEIGRQQVAYLRANPERRVQTCQACGKRGGIVQHLEDYSNPIDGIIGLCHRCHTMVHERWRYPAAWKRYAKAIAAGLRFEPPDPKGHWGRVVGDMCASERAYVTATYEAANVGRTVLNDIADGLLVPKDVRV